MSKATKQTSPTRRQQSHRSELMYLLAVLCPPLLLVLMFAVGGGQEFSAEARFEGVVASLTREGFPTDNHSSTLAFDQRLSKQYARQWREVLVAMRELSGRYSNFSDLLYESKEMPRPNQNWEIEPIARRYTDDAKPVFDLLDLLVVERKPVWQPLLLNGFSTLLPDLQKTRGLVRLLATEFRVAVHQGDRERALHALDLMAGVTRAYDWQVGLVSDYVAMAGLKTQRSLIRQSLALGFWEDEQQLQSLRDQLTSRDDQDARWKQMVASEQAMIAQEIRRNLSSVFGFELYPFGVPPGVIVDLLETVRLAGDVKGVGTIDHIRTLQRSFEQRGQDKNSTSSFTIVGIPLARSTFELGLFGNDYPSASRSYFEDEMQRRWTLTAVAIKQFQIRVGRWPDSLNELSRVGLSRADWLAGGETPFGYSVREDPSEAIVWTSKISHWDHPKLDISPVPPSEVEDDAEQIQKLETRVR